MKFLKSRYVNICVRAPAWIACLRSNVTLAKYHIDNKWLAIVSGHTRGSDMDGENHDAPIGQPLNPVFSQELKHPTKDIKRQDVCCHTPAQPSVTLQMEA